MHSECSSFVEVFSKWKDLQGDKLAFSFLNDSGEVTKSATYVQLFNKCSNLSHYLTNVVNLKPGDRVLLVYPPSIDFIVAFIGCLMAGVIAVPTFPPDPYKLKKDSLVFSSIIESSGASIALTCNLYRNAVKLAEIKNVISDGKSRWDTITWVTTDSLIDNTSFIEDFKPRVNDQGIAFLQYTSGSTSEPKGVVITNQNLIHNLQLIVQALKADQSTVEVSWLPQYHDMGLIGSYLGCIFCGGNGYYLSPFSYIKNPTIWIQCISKFKATHTQAPNFAYTLTARKFLAKIKSLKASSGNASSLEDGLDLSSIRHMINAAEPVESSAIEFFYGVFTPYGLKRGVIYPTYGLAEHTVFVCGNGTKRIVIKKHDMEYDKKIVLTRESALLKYKEEDSDNNSKENSKDSNKKKSTATESSSAAASSSNIDNNSNSNSNNKKKNTDKDEDDIDKPKAIVLMGCGSPKDYKDLDLKIVDTDTCTVLEEDRVGEIWVNSPSKARGYWGLEEKSKVDFHAQLATTATTTGDSNNNNNNNAATYLRTGDLGFIHDGELFICGRLKDLIIIRGRNHYPQDIERTCEVYDANTSNSVTESSAAHNNKNTAVSYDLRPGCSAAFSIPIAGQEVLVYVAELSDDSYHKHENSSKEIKQAHTQALLDRLKSTVKISHGVSLSVIYILPPRQIPKTSSGKIARQWVRRAYLEGSLNVLLSWSDLDSIESADIRDDNLYLTSHSSYSHKSQQQQQDNDEDNHNNEEEKMDPTGQSLEVVLDEMKNAVAKCMGEDKNKITSHLPLASLGMDSMQGIELQELLARKFTIALPDELLFDNDATLHTLALALISGGVYRHRPVLLQGIDIYNEVVRREKSQPKKPFSLYKTIISLNGLIQLDRVQTAADTKKKNSLTSNTTMSNAMSPQWMREHQIKANVDTMKFPDGIALQQVKLQFWDDILAFIYGFLFFGVFMWLPIAGILIFSLLPFTYAIGLIIGFLTIIYNLPVDHWPPAFRSGWTFGLVNRYYSYKVIIEAPVGYYQNVPSIYAFGPHGVFSISPCAQMLINEYCVGENMHFLAASAALMVPIYNIYLKMMGFKAIDRKPFKDTLLSGRSVGIIPGGIAEMFVTNAETEVMIVKNRKGFIALALETGTQIIPCYCFGNTQLFSCGSNRLLESLSRFFRMSLILFWGRFGLPVPHRAPQLTVLGRPIIFPKVDNPSAELINEYHEQYLRETRRIYDQYKNTYNWQDRKLIFRR